MVIIMIIVTKYPEELNFEYNLAMNIDKYYYKYLPIYFRDAYRFSPNTYSKFYENSTSKNIDNSMINDGIFYLDTDNNGRNYYLDTNSGLIYYNQDNVYNVAMGASGSSEYDIFDAAYFRLYIGDPSFKNHTFALPVNVAGSITTLDYMGYKIKDIFSVPILEYTAKSMNDLNNIIKDITYILSSSKFFKKLWFRGQRKEYYETRSYNTLNKLGFPNEYSKMPSLISSLGRYVTNENFNTIVQNMKYWMQAFKVWTLTQSEEFKDIFSINSEPYWEIIKNLETQKIAEYVFECQYDIGEYLLYQNILEEYAEILATQQYGGYTSMLDITDDVDVALFFTQSFLNQKTKKYELCNPQPSNLIYVIAEGRETRTINVSEKMFELATNSGIYQLPPRIANQKCGLMTGASIFNKNSYGYRVIAKIHLQGGDILTTKKVKDMFPDLENDTLYKTYFDAEPKLSGLYG